MTRKPAYVIFHGQQIQLTLEQHEFELHRFIRTQIFFNSKHYSITRPMVG